MGWWWVFAGVFKYFCSLETYRMFHKKRLYH